ncbi:MAG: transposase [Acidobacteriota bacterium]
MDPFEYREFYRRNLPHVQPPEATLFVTFRLADSIPKPLLEQWRQEKRVLLAEWLKKEAVEGNQFAPEAKKEAELEFTRRWFRLFEDSLHEQTSGPFWLKEERVAEVMTEALHYRDGKEYRLDAYCVMANHVHVVFAPLLTEALARKMADKAILRKKGQPAETQTDSSRNSDQNVVLSAIMQSLKGFTAWKANQLLGRRGAFWQHESFDHIIRSQDQWEKVVKYVLDNPVKAGLVENWQDWKGSYRREETV